MISINKQGNAIVIEFTDNDKYLFNGKIEVAPNELIVVVDQSDMVTFKRASNGDVLFSQLVGDIQIAGSPVTKDTVIDQFAIIGFTSGGGGGQGGAVSSVNGQTGDVIITPASLNVYTRAEVDADINAETTERQKQDSALGGMIAAETAARERAVATKQDTLVSGQNIKTINGQSVLGAGNIAIQGGTSNWDDITGKPEFAEVATSGSYNDLSDKPTIPDVSNLATKAEIADMETRTHAAATYATKDEIPDTSELATKEELAAKLDTATYNSEKANFALKSELPDTSTLATKSEVTSGLATKLDVATYNVDKPTFALKTEIPDISGLATKTELSGKLDTATYNSEKASFETKENAAATYQVKGDYATTTQLNSKQDTLVSGTNIKTINGNSLLGEGDITIQAGGTVDTAMSDTSENAVQNKVIKKYIDDLVGNILTQLQEINGTN